MSRSLRSACVVLLLPAIVAAQQDIQYRVAQPGYTYVFPRDHGSHPEFKLEWWYYTGNLRSADGHEYGYELTFFRTGMDRSYENASVWHIRDLYMAHFAVTDITDRKFYYFEKLSRAGPGIAGADIGTLNVWNQNWSARLEGSAMKLVANAGETAIELSLESKKRPAIHGTNGVSQKAEGAGHASHYYSMTRLAANGTLRIGAKPVQVSGESWMDHEFGTNQLTENQAGWDWFSIQLDNGTDLMLYRLRNRDGSLNPYSSGTIVDQNSKTQHIQLAEFAATPGRQWKSTKTGTSYPIEWTIALQGRGTELRLVPLIDDQELVTTRSTGIAYWEGAVQISGTWGGKPVKGKGYLELTGYSEQYKPKI
jgi:predicted secreted hydrolase